MLKMAQTFSKICSIQSNNRLNVTLYRSTLSGLRVAFVDQPSPVINGWFSFATKANSDDGLPHTLEHLVFMGSHKYPYKGFLDNIANRCFASGTNGYTDEDHTAYSITTVGSEGFLKTLPVYLDHLLNPMLTPEQFTTEIHHINGEGRDGGVVYAEMQDHENDMDNIMDRARRHLSLPEGNPYRANTGGALPALRDLCSLERVIDFHKRHYNHTNMIITVVGPIDHAKVINDIASLENFGYSKPADTSRPFDDVVLPEKYSPQVQHVQCPVEDETNGTVTITWQGPLHADENSTALQVLLHYFADGADSPLHQKFIHIADPICSDISRENRERSRLEFAFRFGGVHKKFLNDDNLFQTLPLSVVKESKICMNRMKAILEQQIHQMAVMLEGNTANYYHGLFSVYALYAPGVTAESDNVAYLEKRLNEIENLRGLLQKDEAFWQSLVDQYFTKDHVIIFGHPNAKMVDEVAKKEEARVAEQVKRLGPEGLEKCRKTLEMAVAKNEASAPTEETLKNFIVNNIDDVKLIDVHRELHSASSEASYPTVYHKVDSSFLTGTVVFDLHGLSSEHRSALQLYMELLTESDAEIDGQKVSFETIATMLKKDFIAHKIDLGVKNDYLEFLCFNFVLLPEKYPNIAKWTEIFLKNIIFENSKVAVAAKRLAGNASELKQDGDAVAQALMTKMISSKGSNKLFNCLLSATKFHKKVAEHATSGSDKVVKLLKELSEKIAACPTNVHLIGNEESLKKAASLGWKGLSNNSHNKEFLKGDSKRTVDYSLNKGKTFCIPHGTSESAFLVQRTEAKYDYLDPRIVYAKLLSQYFCQCEGPIFTTIRGKGLAYGAYIYVTGNTGLGLYLYRAADFAKAYAESKRVVLETITSRTIDRDQFEAAKRSLISDLVQSVSHVKKAGKFSVIEQLRGMGPNDHIIKYQIEQIWNATPEKVFDAISSDFVELFDDEKCLRSIVAYKTDLKKVQNFFKNTETMKIEQLYFDANII